ncbi:hypothetical protein MVEN_00051400 [Mycena venus]|uniref:Uncharacterized protein n=1 Tax=Mycena venus TaxID=2733690 RepID=A0A8H7DF01_9AGAR|nr:hypothetical protein MVEN_00051400 [Mycena venus]
MAPPFSKSETKAVGKAVYEAFHTLLNDGLAPETWSQASSRATGILRTELFSKFPQIRLCSNNWKADTLASEKYSQWSRRRKEKIAKSSSRKVEKSGSHKRKSESSESARSAKRAKHNHSSSDKSASSKDKRERSLSKSKKHKPTRSTKPSSTSSDTPNLRKDAEVDADSDSDSERRRCTPEPKTPHSASRSKSPTVIPRSRTHSPSVPHSRSPSPTLPVQLQDTPAETLVANSRPSTVTISNPLGNLFPNKPLASTSRFNNNTTATPPAPQMSAPPHESVKATTKPSKPKADAQSKPVKKKPHKPGAADTAWNLFGHEHMNQNPKDTSEQVKEVWNAIDQSKYKKDAKHLKHKCYAPPDLLGYGHIFHEIVSAQN